MKCQLGMHLTKGKFTKGANKSPAARKMLWIESMPHWKILDIQEAYLSPQRKVKVIMKVEKEMGTSRQNYLLSLWLKIYLYYC